MGINRVLRFLGLALLGVIVVSISGCDYWPPALESQIQALRSDLNDVLDDRQRLEFENSGLRATQESLQREVEMKIQENEELRRRLATMSRAIDGSRAEAQKLRAASTLRSPSAIQGSIRGPSSASESLEEPHIVKIQRLLRWHGFPVRIDGFYGPQTVGAVKRFQRAHGLEIDGMTGPSTTVALQQTPRSVRTVRSVGLRDSRMAGQDVWAIQRTLRRAGYHVTVDGHFGRQTKVAVARFQRARGLYPDGVVGPNTWRALTRTAR